MLFDVHAHLTSPEFEKDRREVVASCQKKNIIIFENGLNYENNKDCLKLAMNFSNVRACLGMHPGYDFDKRVINQIRKNKRKIIAVGEVGLDYKYSNKSEQLKNFEKLIGLAEELKLPLIVHSRKSHNEVIKALKSVEVPVVLHYFTGNKRIISEALKNQMILFGIPSNVVYNEHFQGVVKRLNVDRLVCETDSPYTWKHERNTPLNVENAYESLSELKSIDCSTLTTTINSTIRRVFRV